VSTSGSKFYERLRPPSPQGHPFSSVDCLTYCRCDPGNYLTARANVADGGVIDTIPCFLRVHAQIYLELSDYKRLAQAVLDILSSEGGTSSRAHDDSMLTLQLPTPTVALQGLATVEQ
jgi:hypothetical protein